MKLSLRLVLPGFRAFLLAGVLVAELSGCGRHVAHRPASALSEGDRTLLSRYEDIRAALASDDMRATKRAGASLAAYLKKTPGAAAELASEADTIAAAPALDRARQAFETMSVDMVKLAEGVDGYYVFDTPIPAGAAWVQKTAQSDNPYTGKAMHDIGTLRK